MWSDSNIAKVIRMAKSLCQPSTIENAFNIAIIMIRTIKVDESQCKEHFAPYKT